MSILPRRTMFPELVDWFEEPFLTLRPYLDQPIRVEAYAEDGCYLVKAALPGIDPEKDVEVRVGSGCLPIHAERSETTEGKHRSEFRHGSFTRSMTLCHGIVGRAAGVPAPGPEQGREARGQDALALARISGGALT